ncbi:exo-alpha-sialidase [Maribacter sp. 2307ULW6-5]|uniref:exo-alpha-sialidase n=1 Tax=Maribacter sp. 2307ULW6-5 TaxID=3386275 RepID=UPI0039BC9EBC
MKKTVLLTLIASISMGFTACKTSQENTTITVVASQPVLPVLAMKERNKVLNIGMEVAESATPAQLNAMTFTLRGTTNIADLEEMALLYATTDDFAKATVIGSSKDLSDSFELNLPKPVPANEGHFWLSARLNGTPDLGNKIGVQLQEVTFADGSVAQATMEESGPQRVGIALRQHNDNGVDTYRIPGLATTTKGTLIGVYDIRYNDPVDLQEDVDVGMSRSTDGGQTWEPMKVIMDMGEYGGLPEDQNGIGDPTVLVDPNTNTIWVAALWLHGYPDERAWNASAPGMSPEKTGQFILVKSEDDGLTWSDPINITPQTKKPEWQLFFNGPGMGITMRDGTLVFPAQFKDKDRIPHSTIIYSKDQGKTWTVGTGAKSETTEAQVVELKDGSLMLNMRDDRNRANRKDPENGRSVAITTDLGKTWTEHPTSRKALQESNCMASLIADDHEEKGRILFFSNPNTKVGRDHITIKTSFDEGNTWPLENQLELFEDNTYGYSCMTMIDNEHIGILYEGAKELYFEKVALSELGIE